MYLIRVPIISITYRYPSYTLILRLFNRTPRSLSLSTHNAYRLAGYACT